MAADYTPVLRLLETITLIQGQDGWTAPKLAERFGVDRRTVYRYMKVLDQLGVPYFHDRASGGYRIRRDYFMPPVQLSLDEALAVIALGEHAGSRGQVPLMRAAGKAIAKVRGQLPPAVREQVGALEDAITLDLARAGGDAEVQDVYEKVRRAIVERRALQCTYESIRATLAEEDTDGEQFLFHPYALWYSQRAWYAVGHHAGRDGVRKLKLSRFSRVTLTDRRFAVPRGFSVAKELGNAWRMMRGPTHRVAVRFDREFADTITDTAWHPTQQVDEPDADGRVTLRFTVDGLDEIVWWVLSMGPHAVVLDPPELATRVQQLAAGILDRYQTQPTPKPSRPKRARPH